MKTLVLMAAGIGSRYGGLKQLDSIDQEGNAIIDYSIYDALDVGFNHIIFIIRRELHVDFLKRFSHLQSESVTFSYVFQELTDVPEEYKNNDRKKPWGTGHALLSLRHLVKNNFAIINADDLYGRKSFEVMYNALFNSLNDDRFYMVGYQLQNTLSPYGTVSRGECLLDKHNNLVQVIERTAINKVNNHLMYKTPNGDSESLSEDTVVSMNFWGFTPFIFQFAESMFMDFLKQNYNHPKEEFYLPSIVNKAIEQNILPIGVISTDSIWHGITYKEDKTKLVKAIKVLKTNKIYPENLWKDKTIQSIFNQFEHSTHYKSSTELTSGHINDTYRIKTISDNDFVLQRINKVIFPNVERLIKNKVKVSNNLKKATNYKVIEYIKSSTDGFLAKDPNEQFWTLCTFIKNTETFLIPKNYDMVVQAGMLLGDFHKGMASFDASTLFETIPDFHNLKFRTRQYKNALKKADNGFIETIQNILYQIDSYKEDAEYLDGLRCSEEIPLRVAHNDAKLSNMLFDSNSQKAIAMIDLDTVMPGIIHYDIGDALRSVCASVDEDESDFSKIAFNKNYYKAFMEGYISVIKNELSDIEKQTLPLSIKYMLFEQTLRFLTDYLNGNTYYKVDYPEHNLDRTKNQLRLLQIVYQEFSDIVAITKDIIRG